MKLSAECERGSVGFTSAVSLRVADGGTDVRDEVSMGIAHGGRD